jgi:hypothetical protein
LRVLVQVEQQIKAKRLSFKENSFLDDAALRKKAVRAVMSYHPLWLRLGIDTVLNRRTFQEGDLENVSAVSHADLEAVVREELLSDSTLLVCTPCVFGLAECLLFRQKDCRNSTLTADCIL